MTRGLGFVLVALLLAGCADSPSKASQTVDPDFDINVKATATTGVIRGVVFDEGIRPLADVLVVVTMPEPIQAKTTENGAFAFSGLGPGTYFLQVSKPGYFSTQQSVEVVAGVNDPAVVKVLLQIDIVAMPRAVQGKWDGFLQCGLSVIALCGVAAGVTQDNFAHVMTIEKLPKLVQSEAIWKTTTAASNELWLWHSNANNDTGAFAGTRNSYAWAQGPSPLVMTSNETASNSSKYGTTHDLYLRMFTGSIQGTRNPTDPEGCYPGGAGPDVYCGGVGWSINQAFTVFTTVFYDYLPPEGWTFHGTGEIPKP